MRINFTKTEEDIEVCFIDESEKKTEFKYHLLVKDLFVNKKLEEPLLEGEFTQEEKDSIKKLIEEINKIANIDDTTDDEDEEG